MEWLNELGLDEAISNKVKENINKELATQKENLTKTHTEEKVVLTTKNEDLTKQLKASNNSLNGFKENELSKLIDEKLPSLNIKEDFVGDVKEKINSIMDYGEITDPVKKTEKFIEKTKTYLEENKRFVKEDQTPPLNPKQPEVKPKEDETTFSDSDVMKKANDEYIEAFK